jgi:hypothetical protein
MLSPRRSAQLGLGAACLILVTSIYVLVAGAADTNRQQSDLTAPSAAHAAPVQGHAELVPVGVAQALGVTARE